MHTTFEPVNSSNAPLANLGGTTMLGEVTEPHISGAEAEFRFCRGLEPQRIWLAIKMGSKNRV